MRFLYNAICAFGLASLAGCTETTHVAESGDSPALTSSRPAYGLRLDGEGSSVTDVSVFTRRGNRERDVLVDRCRHADVDTGSPEGLLLPVNCDGRRLVLVEEDGALVMQGAQNARRIPLPASTGN